MLPIIALSLCTCHYKIQGTTTATPHISYRSNDFSIFCFCPFKSFCFSYRLLRSMTSFDCTILLSSCCNFFCCLSNFSFLDNSFSLSSASVSVCSFSKRFVEESFVISCRIASPSFRICSVSCPVAICWWRISDNSSLLPKIVCSSSATSVNRNLHWETFPTACPLLQFPEHRFLPCILYTSNIYMIYVKNRWFVFPSTNYDIKMSSPISLLNLFISIKPFLYCFFWSTGFKSPSLHPQCGIST